MDLSDDVRDKLAQAIELWADENLVGRPAILGPAVFFSMKETLLKKQAEIEERWPINEDQK